MFLTKLLQEVQAAFRQTLTESAYVLKSQANHLGKCVEQARPYYQALDNLREVQLLFLYFEWEYFGLLSLSSKYNI